MIEIHYDPRKYSVTLQGHAGAGIPGQDLVCCAASMLVYTLAANVRRMQKSGWMKKTQIRLAPGDAKVVCTPYANARSRVNSRIDAICMGFLLLQKEYPDFVRFTIINREEIYV